MQRLTKYRILVGTFAVATAGLAAFSVMLQKGSTDARASATQAQDRARATEKQLADRDATIERLKHQIATSGTDQSTMRVAIGAFARQAEACEVVKQQIHVQE